MVDCFGDHFGIVHSWDFSDRVIDNGRHGPRQVLPGRHRRPDGEQKSEAARRRLTTPLTDGHFRAGFPNEPQMCGQQFVDPITEGQYDEL